MFFGSLYAILDPLRTTRIVHIRKVGRTPAFGAPLYGHIQGEVVETGPPCGETEWSERPDRIDMPGHQRKRLNLVQSSQKSGYVEIKNATTRLGDGSAREPKKVVTSCDKSRGEA